jgi:hypothetical protein
MQCAGWKYKWAKSASFYWCFVETVVALRPKVVGGGEGEGEGGGGTGELLEQCSYVL